MMEGNPEVNSLFLTDGSFKLKKRHNSFTACLVETTPHQKLTGT